MAASDTLTGPRAKLGLFDPATGKTNIMGIFTNVTYNMTYDTVDLYILGRYSAGAIEYTGAEVVTLRCSGWRVIKRGPHVTAGVPRLQDLLQSEYLELALIDRQLESQGGDGRIAKFKEVRVVGYDTGVGSRAAGDLTVTFKAIRVSDESVDNSESPASTSLL